MKKIMMMMAASVMMIACTTKTTNPIYNFTAQDAQGQEIRLADYKGKVLLIVNTASRCGFTPQYEEMQDLYETFHSLGLEILDFPCNQFGGQAPENDEDYTAFCQQNYHTTFAQLHKIEVNGENEHPLYTYLKEQQPFAGFDQDHPLTPLLERMFDENMPGWRETNDIKWNFTKFLVDREGNVVARFEPTATAEVMMPAIKDAIGGTHN